MTDPVKLDSEFEPVAAVMPYRVEEAGPGVLCPACLDASSSGILIAPDSRVPLMCGPCFDISVELAAKQSAGEGWDVQRPNPLEKKRFKAAYTKCCEWHRKPVDAGNAEEMYRDLNGRMTTEEMERGFRRCSGSQSEFFPTWQRVRDAGRAAL